MIICLSLPSDMGTKHFQSAIIIYNVVETMCPTCRQACPKAPKGRAPMAGRSRSHHSRSRRWQRRPQWGPDGTVIDVCVPTAPSTFSFSRGCTIKIIKIIMAYIFWSICSLYKTYVCILYIAVINTDWNSCCYSHPRLTPLGFPPPTSHFLYSCYPSHPDRPREGEACLPKASLRPERPYGTYRLGGIHYFPL